MSEQQTAESSGRFVTGLLLGLVGTCLFGSLIGVPLGYLAANASKKSERNRGWNLTPVVVYAEDAVAGAVVTFDMISQRSIPEQFADASMVRPDSASYIINQPVHSAAQAGDPVRWVDMLPPEAAHCFPKQPAAEKPAPE